MLVRILPLEVWEVAVLVCVALVICILSTSMAMESAALFVPAFLLFFPVVLPNFPVIDVNEAIGLTLVVMIFGQTSANIGYWLRSQIDVSIAKRVVMWTIPFAVLGRVISYYLPDRFLLLVFAGLLLILTAVMYDQTGINDPAHSPSINSHSAGENNQHRSHGGLRNRNYFSMGVGGGITGLVGLGMGEISNTILSTGDRLRVHRSIGTSTLILYLTVFSAAATNLLVVQYGKAIGVEPSIPWAIAVVIAPVVLVGGQIGPYINSILPARVIVRFLMVLYVGVAFVTMYRVFG